MGRNGVKSTVQSQITKDILGKPITVMAEKLDYGMSIRLFGGQLSHIGAVAVMNQDGELTSITLPGHKKTVVCEEWAKAFYQQIKEPICVEAGIHYDDLISGKLEYLIEELSIMKCEILGQSPGIRCLSQDS